MQPGRGVAEIVDLSEIEIKAKVNETDRTSLATGASASVSIEGAPALPLTGSTKGVSGLAPRAFWDAGAERQFDASFRLDRSEPALRPGMTARVVIAGERLAGVQHLPRQVLFEKEGKPVVYVKTATGFTPTPVKVVRRTESRVVVEGLAADAEVALTNPERRDRRAARPVRRAPAMPEAASDARPRWPRRGDGPAADHRLRRGVETLRVHKLRSLLTMLGMIFGVAAVVSMMSIGAGRAARGADAHRAARRAQPDRRGARGHRFPGVPEGAQDLAGPDRARPAGHPRERARHHARPRRASASSRRSSSRSRSARCRRSTASSPDYRSIAGLRVASGRFFDEQRGRGGRAGVRARRRRAHGAVRRAQTRSAST